MKRVISIALVALFVVYPVLIYFGMTVFNGRVLGGMVFGLVLVRMGFLIGFDKDKWKQFVPMFGAIASVSLVTIIFDNNQILLLMPVLVNLALLATFGSTLIWPPTMIARFASLKEKVITPSIARYCYRVTVIWCLFFILNGSIALYTTMLDSTEYWAIYNGLISYILIGALLGGEILVRRIVTKSANVAPTMEGKQE